MHFQHEGYIIRCILLMMERYSSSEFWIRFTCIQIITINRPKYIKILIQSSWKHTLNLATHLHRHPVIILQLLHLLKLRLLNTDHLMNVELTSSIITIEVLLRFVVLVYLTWITSVKRSTKIISLIAAWGRLDITALLTAGSSTDGSSLLIYFS